MAKIVSPGLEREHAAPSCVGQVLAMIALFQLVGRMFISGGITKKIAGEGRDPACGVADDRADAEREDPDQHEVDRAADHRAGHARVRERDLQDVVLREDRLAREEGDQDRGQHQCEGDRREDGDLRPQHRAAASARR